MRKFAAVAVIGAVAGSAFAGSPSLYSNQSANANVAQLNAVTVTRSGVTAAAGSYWSECQSDLGNTTESNTSNGSAVSNPFRLADDFVVGGQGWNVTSIKVFAYDTATATPAATFNGGSMNIWNAAPDAAGASIIATMNFGAVTDQIVVNAAGGTGIVNRIFNTTTPSPGTAPGTTRRINQVRFDAVGGSLNLGAGTYWIDYNLNASDGAGGFNPTTTHQDARGVAGANAKQLVSGVWTPILDAGNPAAAPDVAQDLPFLICGTANVVPEPASMTALALGLGALVARRRRK